MSVQTGINGSMRMYYVRHSRARLCQLMAARLFSSRCAVHLCSDYVCSRVTLTSLASVHRDEQLDHQHNNLPQTGSMAQRPSEEDLRPQIGETSAFRKHWASKVSSSELHSNFHFKSISCLLKPLSYWLSKHTTVDGSDVFCV
jgi:hypothetical protein